MVKLPEFHFENYTYPSIIYWVLFPSQPQVPILNSEMFKRF
jgi:hypothetical protein